MYTGKEGLGTMAEKIVSFDSARVRRYLDWIFTGYAVDFADTDYQARLLGRVPRHPRGGTGQAAG